MNPAQFTAYIQNLDTKAKSLAYQVYQLTQTIARVQRTMDRTDTLASPLSQADVDHIIAVQGPDYTAAKAAIAAAYQALP